MVTKFISGILGKKPAASAVTPAQKPGADAVPDELPPLMDEQVNQKQASVSSAAEQKSAQAAPMAGMSATNAPPDELPALESVPLQPAEQKSDGSLGSLEDLEKENIPEPIKKAKMAQEQKKKDVPQQFNPPPTLPPLAASPIFSPQTPVVQPQTAEKLQSQESLKETAAPSQLSSPPSLMASLQPPPSMTPPVTSAAGSDDIGFFSSVLNHISRHEDARAKLLSGDLFNRMDNYWELRKAEIKKGVKLPAQKQIEEELLKKVEELKILEQKWHMQKLALEEDLKYLHQRERDIHGKIAELKLISNELRLFTCIKPQEYFHLHNGVVIKSLRDLIDVLEIIDDETFAYHVNLQKNDFSDWIGAVFKDNNLSQAVKGAKSKQEIIEILQTIPVREEASTMTKWVNPKNYFWLANGTVIRTIFELYDGLRSMEPDIFMRHVNAERNDFADWILNTYSNEILANKLRKAISKEEMLVILEAYHS